MSRFRKLFVRSTVNGDVEPLGEDMAPSPMALAERSALAKETKSTLRDNQQGPFSSSAPAPMRDYTS